MKFVIASYANSQEFSSPADWIRRIKAYLGVLESLSERHSVISIEQINYEGEHRLNGVHYHFMNFGKKRLHFPWRLHRFIKDQQPDIVLIHGLQFPFQIIQLRLKLGFRVKIIVQSHENNPLKGFRKFVQYIADHCIDSYFFSSEAISEAWLDQKLIANRGKIKEVMVGSSIFQLENKEAARAKIGVLGHPMFLSVGGLSPGKDPMVLVNTFLQFVVFQPEARLYMIYHTNELISEIKKLLANSAYKDAVTLIGKVSHVELLDWFNSADFFVSASHFEVFGVAVVEAMSCGCIPIITNIPAFRKITDNGKCGLLFEPGNEQTLLSALMQTTQMNVPEKRNATLEQFRNKLSFDAIAHKIHEITASL